MNTYLHLALALTSATFFSTISFAQTTTPEQSKPAETTAPAPFAFADFSWAPANYAPAESKLATKYFTPEIRLDTAYHYEFSNPIDDTISGSSEVFRHREFQIAHAGIGGDFMVDNVGFRFMTQFGMYSTTTPRNDASPARGQWQLADAYRYISEAYATYHIDKDAGINIQAGIFMSYIGLWSYYNFDNWTYQPSYVSSNTPWFFNGVRVQYFPNDKLKIEPWLINGWQSYGTFIDQPGVGLQVQWRPTGDFIFLGNQYFGKDNFSFPDAKRYHTDDSVMYKYYENQTKTMGKAAASFTFDAGCEDGTGIACSNQYFLGFMLYNRLWFDHDKYGLTIGGGAIKNPGLYLVLVPPINGATATTGALPYWPTDNNFTAWDTQVTGDYMPTRNITFRLEYNHREANQPYFSGHGGVTPVVNGIPQNTNPPPAGFTPDLVKTEDRLTAAMMIRL
jgi:Putative beta-barrel porin-2, OmpL-like. bbp2